MSTDQPFEAQVVVIPLDFKLYDNDPTDKRTTTLYDAAVEKKVRELEKDKWSPLGPIDLPTRWYSGFIRFRLEMGMMGKSVKLVHVEIEFLRGTFDFMKRVCPQCSKSLSIFDVHCGSCGLYIPDTIVDTTPGSTQRVKRQYLLNN